MYDHKIHYCFTLSEEQLEYLRSKKYKMTHFCGVWIAQHYAANINGYCSHFCAASIICIRSLLRHALGINLSSYLLFQDILAFFATKPRHVVTTQWGFDANKT